jgi:hypothetical protein
MIDGGGAFLRESKRAFPSPMTSLLKLAGLASLFPSSPFFARYHLGHLDKDQHHKVDVLAGAFMMLRRTVIDTVGAFDETFFMYGEDVDLSYRIQKAGFQNYYFSGTTIIHFKGESTRRGSLNYVKMFYQAMSTFVKKHYGGTKAGLFTTSIHLAIWLRAAVSAMGKFFRWVGLPVIDAAFILLSFFLVKEIWTHYIRPDIVYPDRLLFLAFPAFTLVYLLAAYYAGLYDRYYKPVNLVRSTVVATLVLLALYALLPEAYRFSRGIVVFGAMGAFVLIFLLRWVLLGMQVLRQPAEKITRPYILVAASKNEFEQFKTFLGASTIQDKIIGRISVNGDKGGAISGLDALEEKAHDLDALEIVFCAGTLTYEEIIRRTASTPDRIKKRFHAAGSRSIVGSDASGSSGETVSGEADLKLLRPSRRRTKRLIDILTSVVFLLSFPLHLFLVRRPGRFLSNCFSVLTANKTWVGYTRKRKHLPMVRPNILGPNGLTPEVQRSLPEENLEHLDQWYAREYEPWNDLKSVLRNYRHLGA